MVPDNSAPRTIGCGMPVANACFVGFTLGPGIFRVWNGTRAGFKLKRTFRFGSPVEVSGTIGPARLLQCMDPADSSLSSPVRWRLRMETAC